MDCALDTPVALFVFNRPQLTRDLLALVRAARPKRLFVVADGPRRERGQTEAILVDETRAILEDIDWPCDVRRLYAAENLGCRARVSSGLDWLFEQVPEAIILEDDCHPSPAWFPFAEAMLQRYRDDDRVAMISGTNYAPDMACDGDYRFARYYSIWGWATWSRAWRTYDPEMESWPATRAAGTLSSLYPDPGLGAYLSDCFDRTHAGQIDTWDFQWFHTCLTANRLCIVPSVNLITNVGYDGTRAPTRGMGMPVSELRLRPNGDPATLLPDVRYERAVWTEHLHAGPPPSTRQRVEGRLLKLAQRARRRA
jgi:hypothetical protein